MSAPVLNRLEVVEALRTTCLRASAFTALFANVRSLSDTALTAEEICALFESIWFDLRDVLEQLNVPDPLQAAGVETASASAG